VGGDSGIGEEVADGDEGHDEEADEGGDAGVEGDGAHDGLAPRVEEETSEGFTLEEGGGLRGQFRVGGVGLGGRADL
jgi:hypothetical protein